MANEGEGGAGGGGGEGGDPTGGLFGGAGGGGGGGADTVHSGGDGDTLAGGGGADTVQGGADPDWLTGFSTTPDGEGASNRDWLKAKGFKDVDSVVKSLRNGEREITALKAGRAMVPGENATTEEKAAFAKAIGVPEAVDGYEIKAPDGVQLDDRLTGRLKEAALKAGLPKAGFEALANDFVQAQLDDIEADRVEQDGKAEAWLKAQGANKDAAVAHVGSAMRALGLTRGDGTALRSALGADRALELLSKLGGGMAEDTLLGGGGNRFGITAAEAKVELAKQNGDPTMYAKLMVKGSPEAARRERLLAVVAAAAEREQRENAA